MACEHDDAVSILTLEVLDKQGRYDAERGASLRTFLTRVIENKVSDFNRKQALRPFRAPPVRARNFGPSKNSREITMYTNEPHIDSATFEVVDDVQKVIMQLDDTQKRICALLGEGMSQVQVAKDMGICRQTVWRAVQDIRKVFAEAGLNEYI